MGNPQEPLDLLAACITRTAGYWGIHVTPAVVADFGSAFCFQSAVAANTSGYRSETRFELVCAAGVEAFLIGAGATCSPVRDLGLQRHEFLSETPAAVDVVKRTYYEPHKVAYQ